MSGDQHLADALTRAAVLAQNERFYAAFRAGDLREMVDVWSTSDQLTCIHPGLPVLAGREAVMDSWRSILSHQPPPLRCFRAEVAMHPAAAVVTGYEAAGRSAAHLACTNVFVFERNDWRLIHHQAGQLARPVTAPASEAVN